MIRPVPNPPMDPEDVARFRAHLRKVFTQDYTEEERRQIRERRARAEAAVARIIANNGGKNPILGY